MATQEESRFTNLALGTRKQSAAKEADRGARLDEASADAWRGYDGRDARDGQSGSSGDLMHERWTVKLKTGVIGHF